MGMSKDGRRIWIDYNDKLSFKLVSIGYTKSEKGFTVRELAIPKFVHIGRTPFAIYNKKLVPCVGADRCDLCQHFKPSKTFPVHIIVNTEEKIFDMPATAHYALVDKIQKLEDAGKVEAEILDTTFVLERLPSGVKPFFICSILSEGKPVEITVTFSEEDMDILKRLDKALKSKEYPNPATMMAKTLTQRYGWSEMKIKEAFEKFLNENGFLKDDLLV